MRQLVAAAPPEHAELLVVLAWSGRRPKAIFHLRVQDCARLIDMTLPRAQRLAYRRADKGGEGRGWGPVAEPAYRVILDRLDELGDAPGDAVLWTAPRGGPLVSTTWPKTFNRIAAAAGVDDVRTYDLRKHARAQALRHLGNHEAILYSGHKTVDVFVRNYAYALEGNAEEAAAWIGWTPGALRVVEDTRD